MRKINWSHFFWALPLVSGIIFYWGNIIGLKSWVINSFDFVIYFQGLAEIAFGESFNPYLTIRGVEILNDHFDPIIYIGALFLNIFGGTVEMATLFEILTWVIFLYQVLYDAKSFPWLVVGVMFCGATLEAIDYPIHSTTWSMIPVYLLFRSINRNDAAGSLVFALSLFLCKETFVYSLLPLSLWFWYNKQRKSAITLALSSLLMLLFYFKFRTQWMGAGVDYKSSFLEPFKEGLAFGALTLLNRFRFLEFFEVLLPLVLPLVFLYKYDRKKLIPLLLYVGPQLAVYSLGGNFLKHYGQIFTTPVIALLATSSSLSQWKSHRKLTVFALLLMISTGIYNYERAFRRIFMIGNRKYTVTEQKIKGTEELMKWRETIPLSDGIMAHSGLTPFLITPGRSVYFIRHFYREQFKGKAPVKYVILYKNYDSFLYPFSKRELEYAHDLCQNEKRREIANELVIIEDPSKECLDYFKDFAPIPDGWVSKQGF